MLKIDIHTHIIPNNLPDFSKKFGYEGFVKLEKRSKTESDMMLFNENFRTIQCNCWDPKARTKDIGAFESKLLYDKISKYANENSFSVEFSGIGYLFDQIRS